MLGRADDRVLVLTEAEALRTENGWVAPVDVERMFRNLRIPPPANVSQHLTRLASSGLVLRQGVRGGWALTPLGKHRVTELIGNLDYERIAAEAAHALGADFAHVRHTVIDPAFAPPRWTVGISRLLERHPFERNVFCMTRFPQSQADTGLLDPVKAVIPLLRAAMR